jgi:hypothetical protein
MYRSLFAALLFFYSASKAQINNISLGQSFQQYAANVANSTNANNHNGSIVAFTPKEDTEGSPYLFKSWAKGHILLKTNKAFEEPSFVLNYDKMKGIIIVKIDERRMLEVDMEQIERFSLEDSTIAYNFFHFTDKPSRFFIELYRDNVYSLYKGTETHFYKADYVNKGLTETGYKYDRYVDEFTYYLKKAGGDPVEIKNVNKSAMKRLAEIEPAVKEFLKVNDLPRKPEQYDAFLIKLTSFLNKPL